MSAVSTAATSTQAFSTSMVNTSTQMDSIPQQEQYPSNPQAVTGNHLVGIRGPGNACWETKRILPFSSRVILQGLLSHAVTAHVDEKSLC